MYKLGTVVSDEEALRLILTGKGIVTCGGYTYLKGHYCADGPAPGCFRGGDVSKLNTNVVGWRSLTLKEFILGHGFFPEAFMLATLTELQFNMEDYGIDLRDMIAFCVNSEYTKDDFHSMNRKTIWREYFDRREAKQTEGSEI